MPRLTTWSSCRRELPIQPVPASATTPRMPPQGHQVLVANELPTSGPEVRRACPTGLGGRALSPAVGHWPLWPTDILIVVGRPQLHGHRCHRDGSHALTTKWHAMVAPS